jgi:hypothetical protein
LIFEAEIENKKKQVRESHGNIIKQWGFWGTQNHFPISSSSLKNKIDVKENTEEEDSNYTLVHI